LAILCLKQIHFSNQKFVQVGNIVIQNRQFVEPLNRGHFSIQTVNYIHEKVLFKATALTVKFHEEEITEKTFCVPERMVPRIE
jgi:hypothetical protein